LERCLASGGQGVSGRRARLHALPPAELLAGLTAQSAAQPAVTLAFAELLAGGAGQELYLRPASSYGFGGGEGAAPTAASEGGGGETTWADVVERARCRGETAIGVLLQGRSELALPADARVRLGPSDRVVVLAEDFC